MNMRFPRLGALAIAAAMQAGLASLAFAQGGPPPSGAPGQQPQGYGAGAAQMVEPAQSNETTPGTELPVLYVTSVEVMRTSTDPKLDIVRVTGLTGSQGWSAPQLVPTFVGKPSDGILDLQFIATMPEQTQTAEGFVPIGAVFPLEEGHLFKGVRVRASENAIEVKQMPGMNSSANQRQRLQGLRRQEVCRAWSGAAGAARRRSRGGSPQGIAVDRTVARHQGDYA